MQESTLVAEHAGDIVSILVWAMSGLFTALCVLLTIISGVIKNGFKGVQERISEFKTEVSEDRKTMLEIINRHENRLTIIETSCRLNHLHKRAEDEIELYHGRSEDRDG